MSCFESAITSIDASTIGAHILRHVLAVSFLHDRVLVEDVVYELGSNANLDFTAFHSFWTRVDELAWFSLALALSGLLCEQ